MKAVIIRNPISGSPQRQMAFARALEVFERAGWDVTVWVTEYKGHSRGLAEEAVRAGYRLVVVAGGDGSIGQVVDGLLHAGGQDVALGIIPMGTGNVFAREVGLPYPTSPGDDAPARAARVIVEHEPVRVDVGLANGHHFLSWAGVGLDARITEEVESRLTFKRRAPLVSYGAIALKTWWRYRPGMMRVVLDEDEVLEGQFPLVVVSNIRLYARYVRLAPEARLDDGWLDLLVVTDSHRLRVMLKAARVAARPTSAVPGVVRRKVRRVRILADPPQSYHLDGDPLGETPLDIRVVPRGLLVHLDRSRLRGVLSQVDGSDG